MFNRSGNKYKLRTCLSNSLFQLSSVFQSSYFIYLGKLRILV